MKRDIRAKFAKSVQIYQFLQIQFDCNKLLILRLKNK